MNNLPHLKKSFPPAMLAMLTLLMLLTWCHRASGWLPICRP